MTIPSRFACAITLVLAGAPGLLAQQGTPQTTNPQTTPKTEQKPAAQKPPEQKPPEQKPDEPQKYEETVVVSASKNEEKLINAPATMSVIGPQTIQSAPTQNFAELLRAVPGMNITQVSARDINVTARGATGTLATGQLAVLDGRSLYQDFFGFVMWDFLPVNLNEIKQIEVIRGPASAVWGANALSGVINVITKSPREMQGTSAVLGVGGFDRSTSTTSQSAGTLFYISGTHAQAVNDRLAFKISAGGYTQDPYARPSGAIACDRPEVCTAARNPYPPFANQGTTQPKFDARVDYDYPDGRKLSFSGGVAGTDGIMHTGIGPFDIDKGSVMGYAKMNFTRKGFRAAVFTNILDGTAANLLTVDPTGTPIGLAFNTKTFDVEASNVQTFQAKHVVTYGGNLRYNTFDLSLAPLAENRTEGGGYVQDEMFLTKMYRLVAGARVDRFDYLDTAVFSPRVAFLIKPEENQTFRLSYNRAYRSPSVINNFLQVTIAEPIDLTPFAGLNPAVRGRIYPLPVLSVGNTGLKVTSVDAYEVGYSGVVAKGKAIVSAAFYVNRTTNDILFTEDTTKRYTAANPPPNFAFGLLPPAVINFIPGASLPAQFTYLNFGKTTQKGLELGVNSTLNQYFGAFVNYSFQATPKVNFALSEVNLPAKNRFNAGVNFNRSRYVGDLNVSYSDSAFWQDVLDERYHGTTTAYTMVNGGFGVKWANNRVTTSVKGTNLGNQTIQQHVFGDIIKRQVVGELRVNF
ncbi:MAG TPA: TonB-dependent receptor [Vicinamibacterales bacterium]|nr:TonB-dependent receptor [Vicinamibacterales bacterium]